MSFSCLISPIRRAGLMVAAGLVAAGFAAAQSASSPAPSPTPTIDQYIHSPFSTAGYSSSQDGLGQAGLSASGLQLAEFSLPGNPASGGAAAFGGGAGGGQYGQGGESGGGHHKLFHGLAFEAGGGFNGPVGNDTPYITWGGNFTVGGGFRFSKVFSTLLEYQFMDDKLPGAFISAVGTQSGNAHFNSITGSPVIDLTPKWHNGVYVVGGFGYYHKSTNFSDYECCDLYGYEVPENVLTITSNQWGGNAGLGIYHRLGGDLYGPDTAGTSEIFAEARYLYVHTPPLSQSNGLGTTELIPVTVGVRF
ncbi:MAG: hypothetical protein ACLPLZ_02150 [Terracidiphilus sp.]